MARNKKKRVSVLNWMGTQFLLAIPGVNLIALIFFSIFSKTPSKRNYMRALLLWIFLLVVLVVIGMILFKENMAEIADWLRTQAETLLQQLPSSGPDPLVP